MQRIDFRPEHAIELAKRAAQSVPKALRDKLNFQKWDEVQRESQGESFTGLDGNALIISAGVIWSWYGCCRVWAILAQGITHRQMLWIHREALCWLDRLQQDASCLRLETTAQAAQEPANRWLRMLGFECEGRLRCYDSAGQDHFLYSRIAWHLKQPQPD